VDVKISEKRSALGRSIRTRARFGLQWVRHKHKDPNRKSDCESRTDRGQKNFAKAQGISVIRQGVISRSALGR
jgi:hypothetical protein